MSIKNAEKRLIDSCPIPAGIKDENSKYLYVNQHYADIVGIKKPSDVIGLTVRDLPTTSSLSSTEYNEQDIKVMRSGKHLPAYCVYRIKSDNRIKVYRYVKYPFKDGNGRTKGVFFSTEDFTNKTAANIGAILCAKKKNGSTENLKKVKSLSKKMQDVLFYVCLGKCSKEIAVALGVSVRTAESYVDQLKDKLGVYCKSDLMAYGAGASIPEVLLTSDINIVVDDDF